MSEVFYSEVVEVPDLDEDLDKFLFLLWRQLCVKLSNAECGLTASFYILNINAIFAKKMCMLVLKVNYQLF